jgi:hypothetical protein
LNINYAFKNFKNNVELALTMSISQLPTLENLLQKKGVTAKLPDGVGQLRIGQGGRFMDSADLLVQGELNGVQVNEVLEFGSDYRSDVATYKSGSVFSQELPNLQVLGALEAVARMNIPQGRKVRLSIPCRNRQSTYGLTLNPGQIKVLESAGYVREAPSFRGATPCYEKAL